MLDPLQSLMLTAAIAAALLGATAIIRPIWKAKKRQWQKEYDRKVKELERMTSDLGRRPKVPRSPRGLTFPRAPIGYHIEAPYGEPRLRPTHNTNAVATPPEPQTPQDSPPIPRFL